MDKGSLRMVRVFLCAAIALLGGTYFPLISMIEPLKITLLISFFLFDGVMGNLMHRLFGKGKGGKLFLMTLGFTAVGLVGRFLLANGNTAAFTLENILGFLITVPAYTIMAYKLLPRSE